MKVKMEVTTKGSPNGIQVNTYEKDQEYDLPEELAVVFLKEGYGIEPPKMMRGAPSDKSMGEVLVDKGPPEVEEEEKVPAKKPAGVKKVKKKKWG